MMIKSKVWMGIGLYQPYADKFRDYALKLKGCPEILFVIADEIQTYNSLINDCTEKEMTRKILFNLGNSLKNEIGGFIVHGWDVLSANERFRTIRQKVFKLYGSNELFKRKVRRLTSSKTGISSRDHMQIDMLTGYALEEISSIYYFAELGYTKAGHQGEKDYDKLAVTTLRKNKEKIGIRVEPKAIQFW